MVKSNKGHHNYLFSFSKLETLLLGQKRFLHFKGPKDILCLFSGWIQNVAIAPAQCFVSKLKKRQSIFLGPLE